MMEEFLLGIIVGVIVGLGIFALATVCSLRDRQDGE